MSDTVTIKQADILNGDVFVALSDGRCFQVTLKQLMTLNPTIKVENYEETTTSDNN